MKRSSLDARSPAFLSKLSKNRRLRFLSISAFIIILGLHTTFYWTRPLPFPPPDFTQIRHFEANLPQHDLSLPFPEGEYGRSVKFTNQVKHLGFNNVLNELLMNSHLAYESRRSYVFQDYVWKKEYYPWRRFEYREWNPRTPLNALISGPVAGGTWGPNDDAPRAISSDWFEVVCPKSKRHVIHTRDVKPSIPAGTEGSIIFDHWKSILLNSTEQCIEIIGDRKDDMFPQTFDLWLWGSDKVLSLWERFRDSPTSQLLQMSPIVSAAVARNQYLFQPRAPKHVGGSIDPFDRMLAIHIRRGDYSDACFDLAKYRSTFYSWNLLPFLPDSFVLPSTARTEEDVVEFYLKRCMPSSQAIVDKVLQSRQDFLDRSSGSGSSIDVLYIMTNDSGEWLSSIITNLKRHGFFNVVTTRDLVLNSEQTEVNPAIDMEIARKAAVFVGNGWSSFTSNIVHRRLVDGRDPISIRFY